MRQRAIPHTPACSSSAYDVGGRTITLLPGSAPDARAIGTRLKALAPPPVPVPQAAEGEPETVQPDVPPDYVHHVNLWSACLVGMSWDDSELELETEVPDHDLRLLDDAALLALARALYTEIMGRSSRRLCVPAMLLGAGPDTLSGNAPRGNAHGTPTSSPVSTS